jgi:hypothetical protein
VKPEVESENLFIEDIVNKQDFDSKSLKEQWHVLKEKINSSLSNKALLNVQAFKQING